MHGGATRRSKYTQGPVESRKHRPDYMLVLIATILAAVGMIVIYSISPAIGALSGEDGLYYFSKHAIALGIGLVSMLLIYVMQVRHMIRLSYVFAALAILGSALILILDGMAFRWIKIGGLSFQPSEMMKLGLLLWMGFFLAKQKSKGLIKDFKQTLRPILVVLAALGLVVVVLQRDLGSMLVLASIAGIMLFIASVPMRPLALLFVGLVALSALAIVSTPYRRDRFNTFLNPERDCQNEGYHACQALIAVGSGGLVGLGVGNSVQAYGYLPETPTDSIFAVYAEKFGFIGSIVLLGVLGLLIMRLLIIANRSTTWEHRLIMSGIIAWIGVQSMINIGAMLGLLPLKGITLPFVSYGGSSLIFVFMALGVALKISCYTSMRSQQLDEGPNDEDTPIGRGDRRTYNAPLSSSARTPRY